MDIGMKAFYNQPKQARRAMDVLKERGLHVNHVHYYKKKWGHIENFNARGNVSRRIGKSFLYGALGGFLGGCALGFILLSLGAINPFQDMGYLGTALSIGVIGMFTVPAFTTGLAAVYSEKAVDVSETDFNGDQVVVDFHVEIEEKEKAEALLKENGAHNILVE